MPSGCSLFNFNPFKLIIRTHVNIWADGVEWHSVCPWTGLPVKAQYAVSYLWLLLLPVAAIAISYFRFREIRFERWN